MLDPEVRLKSGRKRHLTDLNDGRYTFAQIANLIETTYIRPFEVL